MMQKSLAQNALFNMLYKALTVIFPLVTVSYVSHILGALGIGQVSSAQNFVTYFTMVASLGIPTYGVRAIAKKRIHNNKKLTDEVFSELFIINACATTISLISYIIIAAFWINCTELNIIFSSLIILNYLNIEWVYQGFEEYRYITIRSFIVKILSLCLMLLLIRKPSDIEIYAIIVCFGTAGNYIFNMFRLRKYVRFTISKLNLMQHIKPIIVLFASVLAIELYSLMDVTMLTQLTASENVGYYSNAVKIVKMVANTFTAIGAVLLPRLSLYYAQKNNSELEKTISDFLRVILFISIPSCLGILMVADMVVSILFGNSFMPAITTLRILTPLVIMMPLSGGVFGQLLLTTDNENKFLKSVVIGSVGNIILNMLLIPVLAQNGAAIASVVTEALVTILMIIQCRKMANIILDYKCLASIIFSACLMCGAIIIVKNYLGVNGSLIALIIDIVVGVIFYLIGLVITKNDMITTIIDKIKRK